MNLIRKLAVVVVLLSPMAANADLSFVLQRVSDTEAYVTAAGILDGFESPPEPYGNSHVLSFFNPYDVAPTGCVNDQLFGASTMQIGPWLINRAFTLGPDCTEAAGEPWIYVLNNSLDSFLGADMYGYLIEGGVAGTGVQTLNLPTGYTFAAIGSSGAVHGGIGGIGPVVGSWTMVPPTPKVTYTFSAPCENLDPNAGCDAPGLGGLEDGELVTGVLKIDEALVTANTELRLPASSTFWSLELDWGDIKFLSKDQGNSESEIMISFGSDASIVAPTLSLAGTPGGRINLNETCSSVPPQNDPRPCMFFDWNGNALAFGAWQVGVPLPQIAIDGGPKQECQSHTGSDVVLSLVQPVTGLDAADTITSVEWRVHSNFVGYGETIVVPLELGEYDLEVTVNTSSGQRVTGRSKIDVVDTANPEISIAFLDRQGQQINSIDFSGMSSVTLGIEVIDICDSAPVTTAIGGVDVQDDQQLRFLGSQGVLSIETTSLKVQVEATDAAGNSVVRQQILQLH